MVIDELTGEITTDIPVEAPFLRTGWNYDMHAASLQTALDCTGDPGKTQQQFKDECDINTIIRNFGLELPLPENFAMPTSVDITDAITDFHTAQNVVRQAAEQFMLAPAKIRSRFDNDPGKLIAFLEDEGNRAEAEQLGLLQPKAVAPPEPPPSETTGASGLLGAA